MASLTREAVEEYLQNNPDFVKEWYMKNVDRKLLEVWCEKKSRSSGSLARTASLQLQSNANDSLQMMSTAGRNSITTNMFREIIQGKRAFKKAAKQQLSKEQLLEMDERDVFMELIRDIANELDVNILCHKILLNVSILTRSDRGSLFLARGSKENRYLVSKLFDVTEKSKLEDTLHTEETHIRVPFGKGIAGMVAESKQPINIRNAYEDPRFNKEVDLKTGFKTKSILCMPIINYEGELIGVAQIMNKTDGTDEFSTSDEEVFSNYLTFCGIGLTNAQLFEMSILEYKRNQVLLSLAREIFVEQTHLDKLVQKIMLETQELLNCQRCSVYILEDIRDEEEVSVFRKDISPLDKVKRTDCSKRTTPAEVEDAMFAKVFELHQENQGNIINPGLKELKQSKCAQIAKEVAVKGEVLNVADAISDERFGREISDYDGFRIRSLLSLPIWNSDCRIMGVVQFTNKNNGRPFSEADINVVEAFAIFCGLGIHNCQMYEDVCKLMAKQSVALEVLSYHATAPTEDVEKLKNADIPTSDSYNLYTFEFSDFPLNDDDTVRATVRMFLDMDVLNKFHVPYDVVCRWTLSVKKNYRPVIYHNWRHAFNVAQTMFTMLFTGKMAQYMNDLDMFGLIVACLCHDLDHRGTNNAFQNKSDSPLAMLYGTSTMEHHHFDQCIMILNSEGNNIFMHLSPDDYRQAIRCVENAILSTDLALYFKKKGSFQALVDGGEKKWKDPEKNALLRGMMMTACDVAAITKPWEIQREVAHLVASEFFEQGDLERDRLKEEPIAMMDRKKEDELPKMQVGFIDVICIPIYKLMSEHFSGLKPMYDGCLRNHREWQTLAQQIESKNEQPSPYKTSPQTSAVPVVAGQFAKGGTAKNEQPPPYKKNPQTKTPAVPVVAGQTARDGTAGSSKSKPEHPHRDSTSNTKNRSHHANAKGQGHSSHVNSETNEDLPTRLPTRSKSKTCTVI